MVKVLFLAVTQAKKLTFLKSYSPILPFQKRHPKSVLPSFVMQCNTSLSKKPSYRKCKNLTLFPSPTTDSVLAYTTIHPLLITFHKPAPFWQTNFWILYIVLLFHSPNTANLSQWNLSNTHMFLLPKSVHKSTFWT